ncbi:MAG: DNA cytosine methyltransferase [Corallococcus sp.]|nr:DNA cytosine methyltransferase [Corallococcus sp.]
MKRILLGGSPCTHWSIAQKNNRETQPNSGIGWELFKNYLIAKEKFKPDYFLYENNVSAALPIKNEIKKQLGVWDGTFLMPYTDVRYIEINSALVAAQNRERFYVHNCGEVGQPKDRGILLRDVLESGLTDKNKAYCLKHQAGNARDYFKKHHTQVAFERIPEYGKGDKSRSVIAGYACKGDGEGSLLDKCFTDNPNKQKVDYVAERCIFQNPHGYNDGGMKHDKTPTLTANGCWQENNKVVEPLPAYTIAVEFDDNGRPTKAMSYADGKLHTVYEVKDGKITIKGKEYPIKLADGYYIIRKLTVNECRRLQTIPDWYKMPCSDTQNYKMLGNGWTIEVIKHILSHIPGIAKGEPIEVLSMYDGQSCGQIALKELGANVISYYATEIDKYAIQTTQANFPNTIQLGDAFQVRDADWRLPL